MNAELLDLLRELERFGHANDAAAADRSQKMLNITHDTGVFLALLIKAARCRNVLEIGTSNGYSTLWLADAVRSLAGTVTTVDVLPEKAEMARQNFARAGLSAVIRQEVTDAGPFLGRQPPESFDLVFLDSERTQYVAWWPALEALLAPGGLLVVDNAVSHPDEMAAFVAAVQATPGYRTCTVPVGKGEFLAVKPPGGSGERPR